MKRAFTIVEALVVVAGVVILAAFLWPMVARARENNWRASCQSNLKQIGLGFMQYTRDYDETFPPARATSVSGWANVLQPYLKSTQLFHCPSADLTTARFASDYFYNRRFARRPMSIPKNPNSVILAGDGPAGGTTWSSWTQLPSDAVTNRRSPTWRHLDNANYLFADGHVKAFGASQIKQAPVLPSFAIH